MPNKHLIVVMGVSGSGKTTIAKHISENTNLKYLESDEYHSVDNKRHMESGRPLTDEMRWPWIQKICSIIDESPEDIVLANSGLKNVHRACFMKLDRVCHFIHLQVPREILLTRLNMRINHFMPASLLDSQFNDMEMPLPKDPVFNIDGKGTLQAMMAASLSCVENILQMKQEYNVRCKDEN